jgi:glycosyltransferase involved in cell wall biosynthesis
MTKQKSLIFCVTTDLNYDQRMMRICSSLSNAGYAVELVGRLLPHSQKLSDKNYKQTRLHCFFTKGKLFYIEYNIRLFFYLLTFKGNAICAIDLDSMLASCIAARFKRKKFVYDAHEYFTEMEEVVNRPFTKWVWKKLEQFCVPKAHAAYTVSQAYADLFEKEYRKKFAVIRNASVLSDKEPTLEKEYYVLYQGAVNVGRGLYELIEAVKDLPITLVICGKGDIYNDLQEKIQGENLQNKVELKGYVVPAELKDITAKARIGFTLFAANGLSNKYSLANRFFDYMHAAVPQIAMDYPEYQLLNKEFEIAVLIKELSAAEIKKAITLLLNEPNYYKQLQQNACKARLHYNWQNEETKLLGIYSDLLR